MTIEKIEKRARRTDEEIKTLLGKFALYESMAHAAGMLNRMGPVHSMAVALAWVLGYTADPPTAFIEELTNLNDAQYAEMAEKWLKSLRICDAPAVDDKAGLSECGCECCRDSEKSSEEIQE